MLKKIISNEKGISLAGVFWLTVIGFAFFAAYEIIPFYYNQEELRGVLQYQAFKSKKYTNAQIKDNVERQLKILKMPKEIARKLVIYESGNRVNISMPYEEVFAIDFELYKYGRVYFEIYRFQMNPQAEVILSR